MTKQEWLNIGYDKNIIDADIHENIQFFDAYKEWICMKIKMLKSQSVDRIECTWYRYFHDDSISNKYISEITDNNIVDFLFSILSKYPDLGYKELGRIMQILTGVLNYMHDINKGGASLHDWHKVKRLVQVDKVPIKEKFEYAIPDKDIEKLIDLVVNYNIYPVKQCASLMLCMNFFLGLRIGELACLTFGDFDFENNVVNIYKTESKFYERSEDGSRLGTMVYKVVEDCKTVYSVRQIPIMPEVWYIYDKIKEVHELKGYDSEYLCYDGSETILTRSLDRTLRKLCLLCDIEYFNSHLIRKTFATRLHNHNVPTRIISDILGHSEIGTTENCYILSYQHNYQRYYDMMVDSLNYRIEKNPLLIAGEKIEESARRGSNPRPAGLFPDEGFTYGR